MSAEQDFKQVLLDAVSHTSWVALPNIFLQNSRQFFRITYFLALFASVIVAGLFIKSNFNTYFNYEIKTLVSLKDLATGETNFPTVTVCNLQICGFKDYKYSTILQQYKDNETSKLGWDQSAFIDERLRKNQTKTSYFSAQEMFLRTFNDTELEKNLNRENISIRTMLISCRYGQQKCDENDFSSVAIGEFRKCFKFNHNEKGPGKIRNKTNENGMYSGLQLELFLGANENCRSPLTTTAGLAVYVHDQLYTLTDDDMAIEIQPNTQANIAVDRIEITQKPFPYPSRCNFFLFILIL